LVFLGKFLKRTDWVHPLIFLLFIFHISALDNYITSFYINFWIYNIFLESKIWIKQQISVSPKDL
jgi:hypothetical protein